VPEAVWIPTYLGFALLLIAGPGMPGWLLVPILIVTRIILELIYRIAFGEKRHELSCKLVAVATQVIVWCGLWGYLYLGQRSAA